MLRRSVDLTRSDVEPVSRNQKSPQMIKRPLATVVHKDLPVKTGHVENGQEGQSEPS